MALLASSTFSRQANLIEYHPIGIQSNSNNLLNPKFDLSAPSLPRGKSLHSPIPSNPIPTYLNLASALKRNLHLFHVAYLFSCRSNLMWPRLGIKSIQISSNRPRRFLHPKAISSSRRPCSPWPGSLSVGPKILQSVPCSNTRIVIF